MGFVAVCVQRAAVAAQDSESVVAAATASGTTVRLDANANANADNREANKRLCKLGLLMDVVNCC